MYNPWKDVTTQRPYAECDKDDIFSPKYRKKIQISNINSDLLNSNMDNNIVLPEPFIGNFESNVVCLSGNPGQIACNSYNHDTYIKKMLDTLSHSCRDFIWISEEMNQSGHPGALWWKKRTKKLRELIDNPQLFVLEYFPYHSKNMFNFPELKSDKYRNYLLNKAMDDGKLIVIMRAKSLWENIQKGQVDGLGDKLKNYENKIILRNCRSVYLTEGNMTNYRKDWDKFIKYLKQPIKRMSVAD